MGHDPELDGQRPSMDAIRLKFRSAADLARGDLRHFSKNIWPRARRTEHDRFRFFPPRFLFRFLAPCHHRDPLWRADGAATGREASAGRPGGIGGSQPALADVSRGVERGRTGRLPCRVQGKQQPPWCRASRPEDSDGLQLWIDTRDVHNVHRAGRFCHRFIFLPSGGGSGQTFGQSLPINRAREPARPVRAGLLKARASGTDGYVLDALSRPRP